MFQRIARVCALGLFALGAGCRQSGIQACLDLAKGGRFAAAAQRCEKVFVAEGDPRAGATVVLAHYSLGHGDEALAWVDRLDKAGKVRAGVWSLAAALHEQRGEADAADRDYRRDLALYRAADNPGRAAYSLGRLFYLAWNRSRYREAFLYSAEALEEATRSGDRDLRAAAAENLYTALYAVGDLDGARRALDLAGSLEPEGDGELRAHLLANQANLLIGEGRPALARRDLERALELGAASADRQFFRSVHLNLTGIALDAPDGGDAGRAAHHLEEAWKHGEPGGRPEVSLLYYRARVELARGRPAAAAQAVAEALGEDPAPDWAWDLESLRGQAEEALGHPRAAEQAYRKSIAIVEEMRRSLAFDDLKSWLIDRKRQPFERLFDLQARSGRAREALATAERAQARTLLDAFLQAGPSPEGPWSPAVSARRMRELDALLPAMNESPVAAVQPLDSVLKAFGDRHGLVFFEAGDHLWLATVAAGEVRLRPLAAGTAEVRRLGERFLSRPGDPEAASRLGEILLPAGSLPERGRPIHVVADGLLGNLPFAALRRSGRFLVEDHAIVLIPSLSALAALESRSGGPAERPRVLADSRGDLPAAASEGTGGGRAPGGHRPARRRGYGRRAEGRLPLPRAPSRPPHGPGPGGGSWLQLADRRVSGAEVVAVRGGARLVVLASCASGARPGRQMWGSLGAAFLAAGSRAVLASLWSVEDAPARELVLRFYAEGGASDPAGALARAQRVAIGRGVSPERWAPFVLFGSDRPLDEAPWRSET